MTAPVRTQLRHACRVRLPGEGLYVAEHAILTDSWIYFKHMRLVTQAPSLHVLIATERLQ